MNAMKEKQLTVYEKPSMVVISMETWGGLLVGSNDYILKLGHPDNSSFGGNAIGDNGGFFDGGWGDLK